MMSNTNNKNSCAKKPCQSEQFGHTITGSDDKNPDLSGRPVLQTGVLWVGILRKFLIPRPVADNRPCCPRKTRDKSEAEEVAFVTPTGTSSRGNIQQPVPTHSHHKSVEPNFSVSANNDNRSQEFRQQKQSSSGEKQKSKHSPLAALMYQIQEASCALKGEVRQISDDLSELVQDGKASTSEKFNTLRKEEAVAGRYTVISITSLVGYMAGMRRGVAVRLVYAATGAVAAATLCYPEEARHYNSLALTLFREGVLLSLQLLTPGSQKTLAAKDTVEQEVTSNSFNKKNITPETYNKPSQENEISSKVDNDNPTDQEQNFREFEYWQKQNPFSSNSEHITLRKNRSLVENQEKTSKESLSQFSAHDGKLSRECQQDITRVTPYSPAPPVPPEELQPDYTHKAYQNVPNTTPNGSLGSNAKEQLSSNGLHDSHSSLQVNIKHSDHKTSEPENSNPTDIKDAISTLELNKGAVTDYSKSENHSQHYPLNKKLSRYYVEKKHDTITLAETEHDGFISKRGRK